MKDTKVFAILLAICLTAAPKLAAAYDFSSVCSTGQTLYYNYGGGVNGVTVTYPGTTADSPWNGYTRPTGTLIIPSTVVHDGVTYNVVAIGDYAFYNCSSITMLTIPNTVTQIGQESFYQCQGIVWLTLPDSLLLMGSKAFLRCTSLLSVTLPNSLIAVPNEAFEYCSAITSLTVGSGVASFGSHAFHGCTGLTSITCYRSVAPALGSYALQSIPSSVVVTVPCGSMASYQAAWSTFSNIVEMDGASFSATSSDDNIGVVNILTQPTCAAPVAVIEAVAGAGYRFDHWSDGNTLNPRTVTVATDTSLVAFFVQDDQRDTVYVHDTVYVYDTVYIHDTVIVGVESVDALDAKIYSSNGQIIVDGAARNEVTLFDMSGRPLATRQQEQGVVRFDVPCTGAYLVKIGRHAVRKVVAVR